MEAAGRFAEYEQKRALSIDIVMELEKSIAEGDTDSAHESCRQLMEVIEQIKSCEEALWAQGGM